MANMFLRGIQLDTRGILYIMYIMYIMLRYTYTLRLLCHIIYTNNSDHRFTHTHGFRNKYHLSPLGRINASGIE